MGFRDLLQLESARGFFLENKLEIILDLTETLIDETDAMDGRRNTFEQEKSEIKKTLKMFDEEQKNHKE